MLFFLKQTEGLNKMRTIEVGQITETIKEMCIEANHFLSDDMKDALDHAQQTEESSLGRQILGH